MNCDFNQLYRAVPLRCASHCHRFIGVWTLVNCIPLNTKTASIFNHSNRLDFGSCLVLDTYIYKVLYVRRWKTPAKTTSIIFTWIMSTLSPPVRYHAQCQQNPKLNRLVYTKYREMLGSYNEKANDIIQSAPTHVLQTDHRFRFNNNNVK